MNIIKFKVTKSCLLYFAKKTFYEMACEVKCVADEHR